jgi:cell division protease FtsH
VYVPFPDTASREAILRVHAQGVKIDPTVDLRRIARATPGFSGADLAHLINEAAIGASKANQDMVLIHDFEEARDKIMLGKTRKGVVLSENELRMTAFHEAGHALVRLMTPEDTEPLHKVTIIPRGEALGVTHWLPERDKYTKTKEEMIASIMSALGGRIAEELVFGKMSTGAYSDFKSATEIARNMVCNFGMSDDLGPIVYGQDQMTGEYLYSESTAQKIDEAVRKIIDDCYKKSTKILLDNRHQLDKLATALLEKETMYAGEIYELLGIPAREEHRLH